MADSDDTEPRTGMRPTMARSLLVVGLLLAVAATVALVLSDSVRWLRLGVLAALWAALAGAFVAAKFRKDAGTRAEEIDTLHSVYELELEREVAARREHELEMQVEAKRQADSESSQQIAALRTELQALREQLQSLVGGEVLVERVALHAESTRMRSIGETGQQQPVRDNVISARPADGEGQQADQDGQEHVARLRPAGVPAGVGDRTLRQPPVHVQERTSERQAPGYQAGGQQQPGRQDDPRQPYRDPAAADYQRQRRAGQQSAALWPSLPRTHGQDAGAGRRNGSGDRRADGIDPGWTPSWETAERRSAAIPPEAAGEEPGGAGQQARAAEQQPTGRHGGGQGYGQGGRRRRDASEQPGQWQAGRQQAQYEQYDQPEQPRGRHGGGHGATEHAQPSAHGPAHTASHTRHGAGEPEWQQPSEPQPEEPDTGAHSAGRTVADLLGSGVPSRPGRRRRRDG